MMNYAKLLVNIRLPELSGWCNRLSSYYAEQDLSEQPHYAAFVQEFAQLSAELSAAYNRDKIKSSLASLDALRADAFRAIYYLLQGYLYQPSSPQQEQAKLLMDCFGKYGMQTLAMSYDGQTGNMGSFLHDLSSPTLSQAVLQLPGMQDAVEGLQAAQNNFKSKQTDYERALAQQKQNSSTATALKSQILVLLNRRIVNYHTALADTKGEAFLQMANTIDQMILDENELTKARMAAS